MLFDEEGDYANVQADLVACAKAGDFSADVACSFVAVLGWSKKELLKSLGAFDPHTCGERSRSVVTVTTPNSNRNPVMEWCIPHNRPFDVCTELRLQADEEVGA